MEIKYSSIVVFLVGTFLVKVFLIDTSFQGQTKRSGAFDSPIIASEQMPSPVKISRAIASEKR